MCNRINFQYSGDMEIIVAIYSYADNRLGSWVIKKRRLASRTIFFIVLKIKTINTLLYLSRLYPERNWPYNSDRHTDSVLFAGSPWWHLSQNPDSFFIQGLFHASDNFNIGYRAINIDNERAGYSSLHTAAIGRLGIFPGMVDKTHQFGITTRKYRLFIHKIIFIHLPVSFYTRTWCAGCYSASLRICLIAKQESKHYGEEDKECVFSQHVYLCMHCAGSSIFIPTRHLFFSLWQI